MMIGNAPLFFGGESVTRDVTLDVTLGTTTGEGHKVRKAGDAGATWGSRPGPGQQGGCYRCYTLRTVTGASSNVAAVFTVKKSKSPFPKGG